MSRIALCVLALATLLSWAPDVHAKKIKLNGLSVVATGQEIVKAAILPGGKEKDPITVNLLFNTEGTRTYLAFDDQGTTLVGELERTGNDGNTLVLDLDKDSRKEFKKAIKEVAGFTGAIEFDKISFRVTLKENQEIAKVRVKISGTAKVDLIRVDAIYKIKAEGPIEIEP